ncbi:hypothetical protein JD844_009901, partial [Phrynosoma platyrhinos]
ITLPVTMASKMNIVAGKTIVLPCPYGMTKARNPTRVVWKYEGAPIINYIPSQGKAFMGISTLFKVDRSATYKLVDEQKGNFSLQLPDGEEGQYSCEVDGEPPRIYDLQRWHEVMTSGKEYSTARIEWLSPHKQKVTGNEPRWTLENNNWKLQIKNLTVQEDHGTWECHVFPGGLQISYDVKVIGFLNALDDNDTRYAAINNSVVLSCPLNINLTKEKSSENFPELQSWDLMKDNKILIKKNIKIANSTFPAKEIPKVQFEDAGKYHCHFTFAKGHLNKTINLIVMKDAVKNGFLLVEILPGVGVMLLIFAGLFACAVKPIKQKRQRAKRMALAKQHLLAKKTCQCERDLTNNYYLT